MEMFKKLNGFGFALFALIVLCGAIGGAGVASANTHNAIVTIDPDMANCGELGNTFTVNIENDDSVPDADDIFEVRIYKGTYGILDFSCGTDTPTGWTLYDFTSQYGYCEYKTQQYGEYVIEPGEDLDFTFDAIMWSEECYSSFTVSTLDNGQPQGEHDYNYPVVDIDCSPPELTKDIIGVQSGDCPPGEGEFCWIRQDTDIEIYVTDYDSPCDLGLGFCDISYTVDGEPGDSWTLYPDEGGIIHDVINFDEDSVHVLTIYCEDKAGNILEDVETFKVDDTPPETTKTYGEPSFPENINTGAPYPHFIKTSTPITLTPVDPEYDPQFQGDCSIGVDKTWYIDYLVPDEFCKAEQNCIPLCSQFYDDPDNVECINEYQEVCEDWEEEQYESWAQCVMLNVYFGCDGAIQCYPYGGDYQIVASAQVPDPIAWQLYTEPFYKQEESCHMLQYFSVDELGNVEDMNWQCVNVDDTPPVGTKEVEEGENVLWDETIMAADRIMDLQYTDGSWDWVVTDQSGPTGTTYLNIAGVTAQVLLDAYEITGDPKYLDAAIETGDYIVYELDLLPEEQHFNAFNMVFLQRLSVLSGDDSYSDFAEAKMEHLMDDVNFWSNPSNTICDGDGYDGCTPEELVEAESVIRSWSTDPTGIAVWDLYNFIEFSQAAGETSFADDLADELDAYMSDAGFDDSIDYYVLGLSAGIMGLNNAGEDYSTYLALLLAEQNLDGSFGTSEPVQTTAYALMALEAVGETGAAEAASIYLAENFGYSSYDGWKESDGEEYSEVTSEAAQALADVIMNEGTWVTQDTQITLTCTDPDPHPVENEAVCFIVSYDDCQPEDDCVDEFGDPITSGYGFITWQYCEQVDGTMAEDGITCCMDSNTVTFHFKEDSVHDLEYCCKDALGNENEADLEWFRVDTEKPYLVNKVIDGPYHAVTGVCPPESENDQCHLDGDSYIYIDVEDGGPICDVGIDWCHWWYYVNDVRYPAGSAYNIYDPADGIHFTEESEHILHITCQDYLGNHMEDVETFYVDKTPPETTKTYGEPYFSDGVSEWIDTTTPITLTATDAAGDHDSGVKATYYRWIQVGDEICESDARCQEWGGELPGWQTYTPGQPFTIYEESCHLIEFYSIDNVEKQETPKRQCVYVEDDAPTLEKVVGSPNVECVPDEPVPVCIDIYDYETCVGTEGCYVDSYTCDGSPDSCSLFDSDPEACMTVWGCDWVGEAEGYCEGIPDPDACMDLWFMGYTYEECAAVPGCSADAYPIFCDGEAVVDGPWCDYYVTQDTDITFTCEDEGDHPVDHERLCFKVSFDYVEVEPGVYDWGYITEQYCDPEDMQDGYCCMDMSPDGDGRTFVFNFQEDSMHNLEYYCEDALGHSSGVHVQNYKVDTEPPEITKILNDPYYGDCPPESEGDQCYVDTETTIDVETEDGGDICAVGNVQCMWSYEVRDVTGALIASSYERGDFPIFFPEESYHTLYIECWDELGNTAYDEEEFIVDKTPPVIEKDYGDPYVYGSGPEEYITSDTPVYIDVYDPQPHPSGVATVEYRVTQLEDESYCWNPQLCPEAVGSGVWEAGSEDFEFTIPDDSCHLIEVHAVDNVGKESTHKQCVFVDNQAPDPIKEVGQPNSKIYPDDYNWIYYPEANGNCWTGEEGSIDCWKVTTLTPIILDCEDPEPHPVDQERICFHVDFDGMDYTQQHCTDPFFWWKQKPVITDDEDKDWCCYEYWEYNNMWQDSVWLYFSEESEHELEFYCEDALGNRGDLDIEKFKVEGTAFEIPIFQKWNLISVPFQLLDSDPDAVFENVSEEVEAVWTYDAENDEWYAYFPDEPGISDLDAIEPGWGYWVFGNEYTELKIGGSLFKPGPYVPVERLLVEGWNLIGYYGTEWQEYDKSVDPCVYGRGLPFFNNAYNALYSLMGQVTVQDPEQGEDEWASPNWDSLWTFQTCGITNPYNQPYWLPIDYSDKMYPGYGYWIHMDEEDMYAPSFKELDEGWCQWPWCGAG